MTFHRQDMGVTSMCPACSAESGRWLDTSPSTLLPRFGFSHGSGAAYDVSAAGLRERRRSWHKEWAATVRRQRRLIRDGCAAGRHAGVDTPQSSL